MNLFISEFKFSVLGLLYKFFVNANVQKIIAILNANYLFLTIFLREIFLKHLCNATKICIFAYKL